MRKILAYLLVSFAMISCAPVIGIVENNAYKITCDTKAIKKEWETNLNNQNIPAQLVNFEIISNKTETTGETYYLLVAKNNDNTVKIGRKLQLVNDKFSFITTNKSPLSDRVTITCSGCSKGCGIALKEDGKWKCTSCIEGSSCTKSETISDNSPVINR